MKALLEKILRSTVVRDTIYQILDELLPECLDSFIESLVGSEHEQVAGSSGGNSEPSSPAPRVDKSLDY